MIGDANLYIKETEDGLTGEIGVMIAEKSFRKNGLGKEATLSLLRYGKYKVFCFLFSPHL
jgi:RimJ/RimL family protein N-acetyltransferase